jgi:hypothetical protein
VNKSDDDDVERSMSNTAQAVEVLRKSKEAAEKVKDLLDHEIDEHGKIPSVEDEVQECDDVGKALNSRSMYVQRPNGPYDPFAIQRSATAPMNRGNSRLYGPDGIAPLVGDTYEEAKNAESRRTAEDAFKSCAVHGISFRERNGCHPCNIQKSMMCKNCGGAMQKTIGGGSACAKGC